MKTLVFKGNEGQALTSSLLVAEKFGKEHKNVLSSIRELIKGCAENSADPMFVETTFTNEQNGQRYPMFVMNRDGFTLLAMGFAGDKALKFKLDYIAAFNQMEKALKEGKALSEPKKPKSVSPRTIQLMKLDTANWLMKNLNYSDTAKLALAKAIAEPLELPIPVYAKSKGVIHSATDRLSERNIPLSAMKFNQMMVGAGMLKRESRYSRSKGKVVTWPVLVGEGLNYGENGAHPDNPRQTQPSYYDDKFDELLRRLGINTENN